MTESVLRCKTCNAPLKNVVSTLYEDLPIECDRCFWANCKSERGSELLRALYELIFDWRVNVPYNKRSLYEQPKLINREEL